jgi:hypothetical protein
VIRLLALATLLWPAAVLGQLPGNCSRPFEAALQPGTRLSIDVRSGDIEIVGINGAALRVSCRMKDGDRPEEVKITLAANHLRVYGGPNNDVHIRIELPSRTDLLVRSPAGNMTVSGVSGDKDVEIRAGDLTILVGDVDSYRVAEGSVLAGDLNASAFGVVKDGLFRSFRKENAKGRYRLHAKLLAGDLTLK